MTQVNARRSLVGADDFFAMRMAGTKVRGLGLQSRLHISGVSVMLIAISVGLTSARGQG